MSDFTEDVHRNRCLECVTLLLGCDLVCIPHRETSLWSLILEGRLAPILDSIWKYVLFFFPGLNLGYTYMVLIRHD